MFRIPSPNLKRITRKVPYNSGALGFTRVDTTARRCTTCHGGKSSALLYAINSGVFDSIFPPLRHLVGQLVIRHTGSHSRFFVLFGEVLIPGKGIRLLWRTNRLYWPQKSWETSELELWALYESPIKKIRALTFDL